MESKLIIENIIDAYKDAIDNDVKGKDRGEINKNRSKNFIYHITDNLKFLYNDNDIVVFSSSERNKAFKRNELLYDINVCKINKLNSNRNIEYVEKSLVQIECEFEKDTREVVIDCSKLVCGSSPLKVMIISKVSNDKVFRKSLEEVAKSIKDELYLIELEHPEKWDACDKDSYSVYKFDDEWIEI